MIINRDDDEDDSRACAEILLRYFESGAWWRGSHIRILRKGTRYLNASMGIGKRKVFGLCLTKRESLCSTFL